MPDMFISPHQQGLICRVLTALCCGLIFAVTALPSRAMSPEQIIEALQKPENSTGNIADAVEEATGARGWMSADVKPIYDARIVGRAATALMRPVLKNDTRKYQNHILDILDEAAPGSVLVYVMQDGLEIAAMGNLMGTTAKVRGLAGAVIDGAVRDITELRRLQFPVWSRRVSPATSVGRMISVDKQIPVKCGEIMVHPGDYIVADADGVVVVPAAAAVQVVDLLKKYDDKESQMIPIIEREKSMRKAQHPASSIYRASVAMSQLWPSLRRDLGVAPVSLLALVTTRSASYSAICGSAKLSLRRTYCET
nr:RraA family protein [Oxalobacteraceae bacterium]